MGQFITRRYVRVDGAHLREAVERLAGQALDPQNGPEKVTHTVTAETALAQVADSAPGLG